MADPAQSLACEHNEQPRIDACPTLTQQLCLTLCYIGSHSVAYLPNRLETLVQCCVDVGDRWPTKKQRLVLDGRQKRDIESMLCYC